MKSYKNETLKIGDNIVAIETGWHGKIMGTETINRQTMLVCHCVSLVTGETEDDDRRWFVPSDVVLVNCCRRSRTLCDWDERAGGTLHCPTCGKQIARYRQTR